MTPYCYFCRVHRSSRLFFQTVSSLFLKLMAETTVLFCSGFFLLFLVFFVWQCLFYSVTGKHWLSQVFVVLYRYIYSECFLCLFVLYFRAELKLKNIHFPVFRVDYIVLLLQCLKVTNNSISWKRNPNNWVLIYPRKRGHYFQLAGIILWCFSVCFNSVMLPF